MKEGIQRTPEGLSLVDPVADPFVVAAGFSKIVAAYCELPPDIKRNKVAAQLVERQAKLDQMEAVGKMPEAEFYVIKINEEAEASGIPAGIAIYRRALNDVGFWGLEEVDEQFVRMYFWDEIGHQFYNYPHTEGRDNLRQVQAAIATMYSDLEMGAMHSASVRVFHALQTATSLASPTLRGVKVLITGISMGKIEKLPEDWWNEEMERELSQILRK